MSSFNWQENASHVEWFNDTTLNMALTVIDRHVQDGLGNKKALIIEDDNGQVSEFTYEQIVKQSNKVANFLSNNVVNKGDRVFLFLPRIPELYINFLGVLKTGAIAGTMFSAFGSDAIKDRLGNSKAKAIFTTKELAERIHSVKDELPDLEHIFIVDDSQYQKELAASSDTYSMSHTKPDDYAFMLYTSGTTGLLY